MPISNPKIQKQKNVKNGSEQRLRGRTKMMKASVKRGEEDVPCSENDQTAGTFSARHFLNVLTICASKVNKAVRTRPDNNLACIPFPWLSTGDKNTMRSPAAESYVNSDECVQRSGEPCSGQYQLEHPLGQPRAANETFFLNLLPISFFHFSIIQLIAHYSNSSKYHTQ